MTQPTFGFQAPAAFAPQAPAPQTQAAPAVVGMPSVLNVLDTVETFDSGKPKLPRGQYIVELEKALIKPTRNYGDALIVEYKVVQSDNGVSPGVQGSFFRALKQADMTYLAQWLFQVLGARSDADKAQVQRLLKFIIQAAVTGVTVTAPDGTQIAPNVLIGRQARLDVVEGTKPSKKNGKIYDQEYWANAA